MSRPRLKSHAGCQRCRQRHRKCDEIHPVCGDCQRIGLLCIWTRRQTTLDTPGDSRFALVPLTRVRNVSNGYVPFEDSTSYQLFMATVSLLNKFQAPLHRATSGDISMVLTVGLQHDWIRNALVAWADLVYSRRLRQSNHGAFVRYGRACALLRRHLVLGDQLSVSDDIPAFICAVFLGLFEGSSGAPPYSSLIHYAAALHVLGRAKWVNHYPGLTPFIRFAGELSVYNAMLLGLLDSRCDSTLQRIDMDGLKNALVPPSELPLSIYSTSPFFRSNIEIAMLAFQVSVYSRKIHPAHVRETQAAQWLEVISEIDFLRGRPRVGQQACPTDECATRNIIFARAVSLLLRRIRDDNIPSSHHSIQSEVEVAWQALTSLDFRTFHQQGLFWPALTILCAISDRERAVMLTNKFDPRKAVLPSSYPYWYQNAASIILRMRKGRDETVLEDGLGLMVRQDGLLNLTSIGPDSEMSQSAIES